MVGVVRYRAEHRYSCACHIFPREALGGRRAEGLRAISAISRVGRPTNAHLAASYTRRSLTYEFSYFRRDHVWHKMAAPRRIRAADADVSAATGTKYPIVIQLEQLATRRTTSLIYSSSPSYIRIYLEYIPARVLLLITAFVTYAAVDGWTPGAMAGSKVRNKNFPGTGV